VPPHISDMGTNLKGEPVTMAEDRGITLEAIWKFSLNGCVVVLKLPLLVSTVKFSKAYTLPSTIWLWNL